MSYDISIVVPIYNVEQYIEKCAVSLFEQDYENIEYVFVNDCTPDASMDILYQVIERYPHRKNHIKIINHSVNQGSGITRNNAITESSGEYILPVDADDWVELNMISTLLITAKETKADIIICDYFENHHDKEIYKHQRLDQFDDITKAFLCSVTKISYLPIKLCKRTLFNNIKFPSWSCLEDKFITIQLLHLTNNIVYLNKAFYHYNKTNPSSLSVNYTSDKNIADIKQYHNNILLFLNDTNPKLLPYYYSGIVCFLSSACSTHNNFNEVINKISPELNNIKYVINNPYFGVLKKVIYILPIIKLGFIFKIVKKLKKLMGR